MEVLDCIETRRSIRKFTEKPVSRQLLLSLVKEASFAPSWKNTQCVRYTLIDDRALIDAIAEQGVSGFTFNANTLKGAPVLAVQSVVCGRCGYEKDGSFSTNKNDSWEMFDAGISAQTFALAAHNSGLGCVIMGIYDEKKVAELIKLPETERVTALIPLGYPLGAASMPQRKDVEVLARFCSGDC